MSRLLAGISCLVVVAYIACFCNETKNSSEYPRLTRSTVLGTWLSCTRTQTYALYVSVKTKVK